MGWGSALRKTQQEEFAEPIRPQIIPYAVDWSRLVTIDFETYYDSDYTLRKLSTSEYVRDPRFETLMMGIKVGTKPRVVVRASQAKKALKAIPWNTHDLLCHHTQFDGFILHEHYGVKPRFLYDTLSMARALYSNDIGAGLDEVSLYLGGRGKIQGGLASMAGLHVKELEADPARWQQAADYCGNDVDETLRVFKMMLPLIPAEEIEIIDVTCRMFTEPVLKVDCARVEREMKREIAEKEALLLSFLGTPKAVEKMMLAAAPDRALLKKKPNASARDVVIEAARREVASNEKFAELLRAEGIEPPVKVSPAWIKKPIEERDEAKKWAYAFSQTDLEFMALLEHPRKRVRQLAELRLAVKSTINVTRAERFLRAGANGASLPVYLKYAAAHTIRWGGGNKMNMQNLERIERDKEGVPVPGTGELRQSITAPPGHEIAVADSSQIEARVNAELWGQDDLLQDFRNSDAGTGADPYCNFASLIYGRPINKKTDSLERFVGKVCILGLGYQMGAPRLQTTLALGLMGPPVFLDLDLCQAAVNTYRRKNFKIKQGWDKCAQIIRDMAAGRSGSYKCISWEKNTLWLPNGMAMHYPNLRLKTGESEWEEWVYDNKGKESKIYGGLLCENIVQALARIIVAGQLLKISKLHRVVMTTHDEVVTLVKTAAAKKAHAFMVKTMRESPTWMPNIPLNAEGGFDVIYSK
jgi:hypothetical protein